MNSKQMSFRAYVDFTNGQSVLPCHVWHPRTCMEFQEAVPGIPYMCCIVNMAASTSRIIFHETIVRWNW